MSPAPFVSRVADYGEYEQMPLVRDLDKPPRTGDIVVFRSRGRMRYALVTKVGTRLLQTEYTTASAMSDAARYGGPPVVTRKPVPMDDNWLRLAERRTRSARKRTL